MLPAGDAGVTVEFGETIEPDINDRVLAFAQAVEELCRGGATGIIDVVPTYRSATVYIDPLVVNGPALTERLRVLADSLSPGPSRAPRTVEVPVVYGGEFGPDIAALAARACLSVEEAITLHTSVEYRVYMLGFSPGFPYMGKVPGAIAMPRLAHPRTVVPSGSVGIAGSQTGIYPSESPGGWRLIGRTPLRLYDPARANPFLLEAGDCVRFVWIDRQEFERLARMQN